MFRDIEKVGHWVNKILISKVRPFPEFPTWPNKRWKQPKHHRSILSVSRDSPRGIGILREIELFLSVSCWKNEMFAFWWNLICCCLLLSPHYHHTLIRRQASLHASMGRLLPNSTKPTFSDTSISRIYISFSHYHIYFSKLLLVHAFGS